MVREALTLQALDALEPREAAAYFIARRAEGLTSSEEQLLADWLAKDDAHRRMLDSADKAWQSLAGAEDDEIISAMRAHARAPKRQSTIAWRPVAAAAAAVLVAVTAALALIPGLNPWSPKIETIQYASAKGEVKEIQLPDGSTMTLDADSAATGRFGGKVRTVALQRGRAYFAVEHDSSRPFTVEVAERRVVVVGTRFDINLAADVLTVTLLEGRVDIEFEGSSQAPQTLQPGQQYIERLGRGASVRTLGTTSENTTAWRSGLISFDNQSLAEAAAIINRYSSVQIVIKDPDVASLTVSGQLGTDADLVARNLADKYGLRIERRGAEIELLRAN